VVRARERLPPVIYARVAATAPGREGLWLLSLNCALKKLSTNPAHAPVIVSRGNRLKLDGNHLTGGHQTDRIRRVLWPARVQNILVGLDVVNHMASHRQRQGPPLLGSCGNERAAWHENQSCFRYTIHDMLLGFYLSAQQDSVRLEESTTSAMDHPTLAAVTIAGTCLHVLGSLYSAFSLSSRGRGRPGREVWFEKDRRKSESNPAPTAASEAPAQQVFQHQLSEQREPPPASPLFS